MNFTHNTGDYPIGIEFNNSATHTTTGLRRVLLNPEFSAAKRDILPRENDAARTTEVLEAS